jgi:hypothetical protein
MLGRTRKFFYRLILLGRRYLSFLSRALTGNRVPAPAPALPSVAIYAGSKSAF